MRMRLVSAAFLAVLVGCSDSTKPVDPASVASISLTPTAIGVVKGSTQSMTLTAKDSSGNEVRVNASWTSSAAAIATVSGSGVVSAVSYGSTTITATVGTRTASAAVVVTSVPTTKAYSVLDLGASLHVGSLLRQLSDSGDVVDGNLYRHGVFTAIPGCSNALTINGPGHVLCRTTIYDSVSTYAIWRNGTLTPLAASDTFAAQHFRAFAINDSDEVAGLFYMPSFANVNCPATGVRCLSIWKNGQASFPGYDAGGSDVMLMNNKGQIAVEYAMWAPDQGMGTTIYDIPSRTGRGTHYGVRALNDNGWAAIDSPQLYHGSPSHVSSTAEVFTPSGLTVLGSGGASGINNANVVVGTLDVGPFIWRGQGVSLLTNASVDPSWTITGADEINNRGQILATADNSDGRKAHTVILTPAQP